MNQEILLMCTPFGDVDCLIDYEIENDGIGSYEFWGSIGFDSGKDYAVIDDIKPIFTNEEDDEKANILQHLEDNFKDIATKFEEQLDRIIELEKEEYYG